MATVITEECINCGACEPECPNTAIYQGGVEWEFNGTMSPAINAELFYIVPEKCTECVGFFDQEACAAVCPVDCCVPDPARPETEEQLFVRAKELHPDETFDENFPSRFKEKAGGGEAPADAAPAAAAAPVAAAAPAATAAPGRVEKAVKPAYKPKTPEGPRDFTGELKEDFDDLLLRLQRPPGGTTGFLTGLVAMVGMPILGALPDGTKRKLQDVVANRMLFSAAGATGLNVFHNFILYPVLFAVAGVLVFGGNIWTLGFEDYLLYGVTVASIETMWRLRGSMFRGVPVEDSNLGPAFYGLFLLPLAAPIVSLLSHGRESGTLAFDGFYDGQFDEKRDRERRYGEVYRIQDIGRGYLVQLEFPRQLPQTSLKDELGLSDDMPDYDFDLALTNGSFVVRGNVVDPLVRKIASGSPSFPPDFTTRIALEAPVEGFKHRYRDQEKVLEVLLVKRS